MEKRRPVHVAGTLTAGDVGDDDFGLKMEGLKLQRNTEYCQWYAAS